MANYGDWAKNKDQKMPETDFDYIARHFDDIIDGEIKAGNNGGKDGWPQIRKTIRLKRALGVIQVNEYIDKRQHVIEKFEYDWQYMEGKQWKFHYDTYHPKQFWTETVHYHQHDEPTANQSEHERIANFRMRDLLHILESISLIDRYSQESSKQKEIEKPSKKRK